MEEILSTCKTKRGPRLASRAGRERHKDAKVVRRQHWQPPRGAAAAGLAVGRPRDGLGAHELGALDAAFCVDVFVWFGVLVWCVVLCWSVVRVWINN